MSKASDILHKVFLQKAVDVRYPSHIEENLNPQEEVMEQKKGTLTKEKIAEIRKQTDFESKFRMTTEKYFFMKKLLRKYLTLE